MREQMQNYIQTALLSGFALSKDLPYTSSGEELFIKNAKRIYVSDPEVVQEPFISVMSSHNIDSEVTTLRVVFSTDAKQRPSNYDSQVAALRAIKEQFVPNYFRRECTVTRETQADLEVTELEFVFTRLIN